MIKTLTKTIKYSVVFNYTLNNFDKRRNMIVHHGVIGSCKNFKNFTKHHEISDYVNSYLIDCRNHSQSPHTASNKISDLADDLHEFIIQNELDKNKGLTLMGHSMGAMALMAFT
jgi:esterase